MHDKSDQGPPRVEVTAQFLADSAAKQRAYQQRRQMWTAVFRPSTPRAQAASRSQRAGRIHDARQSKLDL